MLHTLQSLKRQAMEGVPYMKKNLPKGIYEPGDLFQLLKDITTYKHDPKGVELIHTPQSFFEDNFHGKSGAGDCDDFTCISIAALKALNVPDQKIKVILTGKNKTGARHIYLKVDDVPFDLTNDRIGQERKYPYKQEIPLKLL